jgi:hypothetical protein
MLRVAQGRWRDMIQVFDEAREGLPADRVVGRERLAGAARFHRLLLDRVDRLVGDWREICQKSKQPTDDAA